MTIGSFGDRFAAIAGAFGAAVDRLEVEWGQAAEPAELESLLSAREPYRAVLVTHNETSTGVTNPLRELVAVVRAAPGQPLIVVDGISGLGAMPFEMDAWGVDVVVSASQKAWMAAPGIALAALSERAQAAAASAGMPRFYWDFAEARRWAAKGQTPWTPAVAVLYGLRAGVRRLLVEGRERTWARHAAVASGTQAGLEALGLRLVAPPDHRSATVTAAWLPEDLEWGPFNARMRARGLVVAGGQGKLAGRILRFGHMGMVEVGEIADAIRVMGETMVDSGRQVDPAAAVEAAITAGGAASRGCLPSPCRNELTERLLLVRHGVTDWNREGRFQGHLDAPLADDGRLEARLLGARLAADAREVHGSPSSAHRSHVPSRRPA